MRICGFCGAHDVSQEHLWAGWLGTVILKSRAEGGAKTFNAQIERGGKASSFQKNDLEMTVGMPCEPCNNGWMSALENEVKGFMTPMVFRGDKTILDADRQRSLVRWVVKTAMVYEFTGRKDEPKYFTPDERKAFKEGFALPPNLWIWLARYDGVMPLHSLQLRGPKHAPEIYSLTFGSNFLITQVFACRDPRFRQIAEATKGPRLQTLYPNADEWIVWPPEKTIDDDELQVLDYRFAKVIGGSVG